MSSKRPQRRLRDETVRRPLVSAVDAPDIIQPRITISSQRYHALTMVATERAATSSGTITRHIQGILGEQGVARWRGHPDAVNTDIYEGDGDDGYDLSIDGRRLEVKTVNERANNPPLMIPGYQRLLADEYVLCQLVGQRTVRVIGYATRETVKRTEPTPNTIPGMPERTRDIGQDELYPAVRRS